MTLNKIKRLKNLMDDTILTYAVLINDDYILIKQKKYPRIYRKLDMIYEDIDMKYSELKMKAKQCDVDKIKSEIIIEMNKLSYFIGI